MDTANNDQLHLEQRSIGEYQILHDDWFLIPCQAQWLNRTKEASSGAWSGGEHLKMMRLVFLGLLLMLPAATAVSEDTDGSADGGIGAIIDDEDLFVQESRDLDGESPGEVAGVKEAADHLTMIIIIVAVAALILSAVVIITVVLVRRRLHNRQQGIYFVPAEQDQKEAI